MTPATATTPAAATRSRRTIWAWADRGALLMLLSGAALLFQPWWQPGFFYGFWVLLVATPVQIITAHLPHERSA